MEKSVNIAKTVAEPEYASTIKGNRAAGIVVAPGSVSTTNISHVARNVVERATVYLMDERNRAASTAVAPPCVVTVKGGHDARIVGDLICACMVDKRTSARIAES